MKIFVASCMTFTPRIRDAFIYLKIQDDTRARAKCADGAAKFG